MAVVIDVTGHLHMMSAIAGYLAVNLGKSIIGTGRPYTSDELRQVVKDFVPNVSLEITGLEDTELKATVDELFAAGKVNLLTAEYDQEGQFVGYDERRPS